MSKPHVCPKCDGMKKIVDARCGAASSITWIDCPPCGGQGIVWEPDKPNSSPSQRTEWEPENPMIGEG
mgnify:CR=1 FL=1